MTFDRTTGKMQIQLTKVNLHWFLKNTQAPVEPYFIGDQIIKNNIGRRIEK